MDKSRRYGLQLFRESLKGLQGKYAFFLVATLALGLTALFPAQFLTHFTRHVVHFNEMTTPVFLWRVGWFGILVSLSLFVSSFLSLLLNAWFRLEVETNLRLRVLRRLHTLPIDSLDGKQRGEWVAQMTSDLSETEKFLIQIFPCQVRFVSILLGGGLLFAWSSGVFAWIPILGALLLSVLQIGIQTYLSPRLATVNDLHDSVFQSLIETLGGIRTIRSQQAEAILERRFFERLSSIKDIGYSILLRTGLLTGGNEFFGQLAAVILLCSVGYTMGKNRLTWETVLLYPFYSHLFYGAALGLAKSMLAWKNFLQVGTRLGESLLGSFDDSVIRHLERELVSQIESIELKHLVFGYDKDRTVTLEKVWLHRQASWAIVGPSGSGKSTLLEVLAGIRPAREGEIRILGKNQEVLWKPSVQGKSNIPMGIAAYVEQQPYVFEGTLRENLLLGNPFKYTDGQLWRAMAEVGMESFVTIRRGFECQLKDRGSNLSEGERYRIALCRALLLNRPFLLLDEPFASLDRDSVEIVIQALKKISGSVGVLVVTHYLPKNFSVDGLISVENAVAEVVGTGGISQNTELSHENDDFEIELIPEVQEVPSQTEGR